MSSATPPPARDQQAVDPKTCEPKTCEPQARDPQTRDARPVDPAFVFPFDAYDDPGPGQRWSTWWEVEPLCRGPEPRPPWVVTDRGAVDTELGILKTGKEADVFLVERAVLDGPGTVMAAKRYRGADHSDFHRSAIYAEGRRGRNTRDARAVARGTRFGHTVAAGQWARAEWEALTQLWRLGLPVPYPVQLDRTELLMEWVTTGPADDLVTAPRLAQTRPGPVLLASYFEQLRAVMAALARHGLVHGDLSAYNVLASGDRLVVIDLPQVVDLVGNRRGPELLLRDCSNVCRWFRRRGLDERVADEQALFGDLLAGAFR